MTMRWTTTLVAVLLLAAGVLTATAREARAAGEWETRYRCATGGFDLTSVVSSRPTDDDPGVIPVSVDGALTCGTAPEGATFALAYYWRGSPFGRISLRYGFQSYDPRGGPHPFRAVGGVSLGEPLTVCVLSDVDLRVACVEMKPSLSGASGTVTTTVVSPRDKALDIPVRFTDITLDPGCTTCWRMERP